jgi:hypothetical protein
MIPLETSVYRAPLGLQFIDSVTGGPVADGLVVTAWPAGVPWAARMATQSPVSAIMGFGQLPGLASYENALTDDPETFTWSAPSAGQPFEVRVADPLGRYLPELLALTVPQPALVTPSLYSAPARPVPPGFATVRGEVWSATSPPQPAAWAVVQIAADANSYLTVADQAGRYVIYLPYPEALPPLTGSPGGVPLGQMTWPITVSVLYQPSAQTWLADAAPGDPPELTSLLQGQGTAGIVVGGGTQYELTATLTFGTPVLLMLQVISA